MGRTVPTPPLAAGVEAGLPLTPDPPGGPYHQPELPFGPPN